MEKSNSQSHRRQPKTRLCLLLFLSIFILGSASLVYLKYQFITTHLRFLFPNSAVPTLDAAPGGTLTFPTSKVQGKKFNHFVTIWLENQDYSIAAGDPNMQWAAAHGITLTNFFALTHPSQPNYVAAVGGSTHGVWNDRFSRIPRSVRNLADLLDDKGISWSLYQEDMPYTGFTGNWVNQETGANMYVRKHNPLMSYDSCTMNPSCLARSKNFTLFYEELENDALPQWMFITPNMTNDGHDTSITTAGSFVRRFIEPLLADERFMNNTLVLLTFDETERYYIPNKVFSVLLGDVIPKSKWGTTYATRYDHYSMLATLEENWDLGNLGLNDVHATRFY